MKHTLLLLISAAAWAQEVMPPVLASVYPSNKEIEIGCLKDAEIAVTFGSSDPIKKTCPDSGLVTFDAPRSGFTSGMTVKAIQSVSGKKSEPVLRTVPGDAFDWGRTTATFSGGVMFSKERDEFSKSDVFLSLDVEKNWLQYGDKRVYVTSFFDAMLAAVPVAPNNPDSSRDKAAATPSNLDTFTASKKAAILRVGAYTPIVVTKWTHSDQDHGLFVAPLVKAGIQTITDSRNALGQNSTSGGARLYDDLYNFHAFGVRFGHLELNRTKHNAPFLVSYIDLALGRFENFELCRESRTTSTLTTCQAALPEFLRVRPWRYSFEGKLKLPLKGLPFYVGFYANGGQGPDDLRFVFGTSFDVGKIASKLQF